MRCTYKSLSVEGTANREVAIVSGIFKHPSSGERRTTRGALSDGLSDEDARSHRRTSSLWDVSTPPAPSNVS